MTYMTLMDSVPIINLDYESTIHISFMNNQNAQIYNTTDTNQNSRISATKNTVINLWL